MASDPKPMADQWRELGESLGAVWNELAKSMCAMVDGFTSATKRLPWYKRLWYWLVSV